MLSPKKKFILQTCKQYIDRKSYYDMTKDGLIRRNMSKKEQILDNGDYCLLCGAYVTEGNCLCPACQSGIEQGLNLNYLRNYRTKNAEKQNAKDQQ